MNNEVPLGWTPLGRSSPFLGPLWVHPDGPCSGVRTDERHLNSRGAVHGGALGPVADTMLGYALAYGADRSVVLITAHLSIDLLGGIGPGQ
jgi:acyl-coenzyme A thioesterase PaaI-like protein